MQGKRIDVVVRTVALQQEGPGLRSTIWVWSGVCTFSLISMSSLNGVSLTGDSK